MGNEWRLFHSEDLAALRQIADARITHIHKAEYDDADKALKRLGTHTHQLLDLIDSQAAEIVRHRANAAESVGLAGERIGTIAALRHEVTDQAAENERLREVVEKIKVFAECERLEDKRRHYLAGNWMSVIAMCCDSAPEAAQSTVQETKQDG